MIRLGRVRSVKGLPDRVEIHTSGPATYVIHQGIGSVNILWGGLRRPRGRRPLATFLYFPDGEGATVLVEERDGRCTVLVREERPAAAPAPDALAPGLT